MKKIKYKGRYKADEIMDLSEQTAEKAVEIISQKTYPNIKLLILPLQESTTLTRSNVLNFMNLREVYWPKAPQINDCLFKRTSLKYITINDCPEIGEHSFAYSRLTEIILPSNLKTLGVGAFEFCKELKRVDMSNLNNPINIPIDCFEMTSSLTEFNFDNISVVGPNAFAGSGIKSIEFNSPIKFGNRAFAESKLHDVTFNVQVQLESNGIFLSCYYLSEVNFNNNIDEIPDNFFLGCYQLTTLKNTQSIKIVGDSAFKSTKISTFDAPNLEYIGNYAFAFSFLRNMYIPDSVSYIGYNAFYSCKMLKSISWSKNCKTIKTSVFEKCNELNTLKGFEFVESVGKNAFKEVPGDIYFENLKNIEENSFLDTTGKIDLRKTAIVDDSICFQDNIILPYFY